MGILNRIKKTKADVPSTENGQTTLSSQKRAEILDVVLHPLLSEKAAKLAGSNQYVFVVRKDANRLQIRAAIKSMYSVSPLEVNVVNVQGKQVRFGRRQGKRSDWKKAIVTLPVGQSINVHEGV